MCPRRADEALKFFAVLAKIACGHVDLSGAGMDHDRGSMSIATNQDISQALSLLRDQLADARESVLKHLSAVADEEQINLASASNAMQSDLAALRTDFAKHAKDLAAGELQQEVSIKHGNLGRCCCKLGSNQAGPDRFDVDGDGEVDEDELRQGLTNIGSNATANSIHHAHASADVDGDSKLSKKEFSMLMTRFDSWFHTLQDGSIAECTWKDLNGTEPATHHCPVDLVDYLQLPSLGKDLLLLSSSSYSCAAAAGLTGQLSDKIDLMERAE